MGGDEQNERPIPIHSWGAFRSTAARLGHNNIIIVSRFDAHPPGVSPGNIVQLIQFCTRMI